MCKRGYSTADLYYDATNQTLGCVFYHNIICYADGCVFIHETTYGGREGHLFDHPRWNLI